MLKDGEILQTSRLLESTPILVSSLQVLAVSWEATLYGCLVDEFRLLDKVHILDALAEVALVELLAVDHLVETLQLCQREEVGKHV